MFKKRYAINVLRLNKNKHNKINRINNRVNKTVFKKVKINHSNNKINLNKLKINHNNKMIIKMINNKIKI